MVDLFQTFDCDLESEPIDREPGDYEAAYTDPCDVPEGRLAYRWSASTVSKASPEQAYQNYQGVLTFEVEERSFNTHHKGYRRGRPGSVLGQGAWRTSSVSTSRR